MANVVERCPYRIAPKVAPIVFKTVEERFDFQIGENGQLERVSLGEFDILKEVDSHIGEVGLINCLKLAEARGLDINSFAKTEPGVMADIGEVNTLDDLLKAKAAADAKLATIAASYGISTKQLLDCLRTGQLPSINKGQPEQEGGNENA